MELPVKIVSGWKFEKSDFTPMIIKRKLPTLKVHQCRFENLPISSSTYKNNMSKITL